MSDEDDASTVVVVDHVIGAHNHVWLLLLMRWEWVCPPPVPVPLPLPSVAAWESAKPWKQHLTSSICTTLKDSWYHTPQCPLTTLKCDVLYILHTTRRVYKGTVPPHSCSKKKYIIIYILPLESLVSIHQHLLFLCISGGCFFLPPPLPLSFVR